MVPPVMESWLERRNISEPEKVWFGGRFSSMLVLLPRRAPGSPGVGLE